MRVEATLCYRDNTEYTTAKTRKLQMMQNHEQIVQQANCDTQVDDFNF
jgi:hypothetical protein